MGCGSSKSIPYEQDTKRGTQNRRIPRIDTGRPVGGSPSDPEKRAAQLAAAEKRATMEANRGLGAGSSKGVELSEAARKQELIGKITAIYQSQNKEVPMGLHLASSDQLRNHLETLRK